MTHTLITAHAGAENTCPNTLESLRALAALGADALEVDVRGQGDTLYLSHNELEEDARCDTLADCLTAVRPHEGLLLNLDLKTEGLARASAELAQSLGMEKRILFTGSLNADDEAAARAHRIPVWYNEDRLPPEAQADVAAALAAKGCDVLNTHWSQVTPERAARLGARLFSVWTVDTEEQLAAFLRLGVHGITTRFPAMALRLRREIQG